MAGRNIERAHRLVSVPYLTIERLGPNDLLYRHKFSIFTSTMSSKMYDGDVKERKWLQCHSCPSNNVQGSTEKHLPRFQFQQLFQVLTLRYCNTSMSARLGVLHLLHHRCLQTLSMSIRTSVLCHTFRLGKQFIFPTKACTTSNSLEALFSSLTDISKGQLQITMTGICQRNGPENGVIFTTSSLTCRNVYSLSGHLDITCQRAAEDSMHPIRVVIAFMSFRE